MRKILFFLLPILFFGAAYVLPLDSRDLIEADETRYAEIAREMLASGDWIVPRLDGVRYFEKPVLGYWIYAASQKFFGETPFAVRLPSVAATAATACLLFLLVWQACRRSWPKKNRKERKDAKKAAKAAGETAFLPAEPLVSASLAVIIYLSLSGVFGIGSVAVLDAIFTFFVTGSLTFFFFALESPKNIIREYGFLFLAALFCAAAFLTKGFLALVLPILIIVAWLCWRRRFIDILRMSWLPLLTVFFVTLPWTLQIHWWEKDFWHFFIVNEHLHRFLAEDAQHKEPFWFFFAYAPALFLPWLLLLPAAISSFWNKGKENNTENAVDRLACFSLFWLILPFLFFSCSQGKLLTYILPCCPPFAAWLTIGLTRFFSQKETGYYFRGAVIVQGLFFFSALLLLICLQMFGMEGLQQLSFTPGGTPLFQQAQKVGLVAGAFTCSIFLYFILCYKGRGIDRPFLFALTFLPIFSAFWFSLPDFVMEQRMPGAFFEQYKARIDKDDILIAEAGALRGVCWYFKRDDVHTIYWAGELDYGMKYDDSKINGIPRILTFEQIDQLAKKYPNRIVLVARERYINEWRDRLPKPLFEVNNGKNGYGIMRL